MQTVKTTLLVLISVALLGACGLRGPLYLPDEDPASKPATEVDSAQDDSAQDKEQTENPEEDDGNEKKKTDTR